MPDAKSLAFPGQINKFGRADDFSRAAIRLKRKERRERDLQLNFMLAYEVYNLYEGVSVSLITAEGPEGRQLAGLSTDPWLKDEGKDTSNSLRRGAQFVCAVCTNTHTLFPALSPLTSVN